MNNLVPVYFIPCNSYIPYIYLLVVCPFNPFYLIIYNPYFPLFGYIYFIS